LAAHGLLELELVSLGPTRYRERPTRMLVVLAPTRCLHHTVQRDELAHHDPRHFVPPSSFPLQIRPQVQPEVLDREERKRRTGVESATTSMGSLRSTN